MYHNPDKSTCMLAKLFFLQFCLFLFCEYECLACMCVSICNSNLGGQKRPRIGVMAHWKPSRACWEPNSDPLHDHCAPLRFTSYSSRWMVLRGGSCKSPEFREQCEGTGHSTRGIWYWEDTVAIELTGVCPVDIPGSTTCLVCRRENHHICWCKWCML